MIREQPDVVSWVSEWQAYFQESRVWLDLTSRKFKRVWREAGVPSHWIPIEQRQLGWFQPLRKPWREQLQQWQPEVVIFLAPAPFAIARHVACLLPDALKFSPFRSSWVSWVDILCGTGSVSSFVTTFKEQFLTPKSHADAG